MNRFLESIGWIGKFQKPNHDLRKYYGSKRILEGVPNHVVAKWMGTSVPVLETTYAKELATIEKSYYQTNFGVTNGVTNAI